MKLKTAKFIEGFLAGFVIGIFVYFVFFLYKETEFSITWALVFSLTPAIILGFLLTIEKSKPLQGKVLALEEAEKSFKITETKRSSKYLAIGAFVLGLVSLLGFSLIFTTLAFVFGIAALVKGKKEALSTKLKLLAVLGILFSLISVVATIYNLT